METRRSRRTKEEVKYEETEESPIKSESDTDSNSKDRKSKDKSVNGKQKANKEEKEKKGRGKGKRGKWKRKKGKGTHRWTGLHKRGSDSGSESSSEDDEKEVFGDWRTKEAEKIEKTKLRVLEKKYGEGKIEKRQRSARLQAEEEELNRKPMTVEEMEEERRRKRDSVKVLERQEGFADFESARRWAERYHPIVISCCSFHSF